MKSLCRTESSHNASLHKCCFGISSSLKPEHCASLWICVFTFHKSKKYDETFNCTSGMSASAGSGSSPPLHKLDTILCGRRNGFSKPSSDFGGKPCLTLLASGSLKQVSYSLCLGYRSGKNVLSWVWAPGFFCVCCEDWPINESEGNHYGS